MEVGLFYINPYETVFSDKDTGWRNLQHPQSVFKNREEEKMQRHVNCVELK